jgi:hypothetical protein
MRRDVMVISLAVLGGYAQIRRVRVSLPLVPALLDEAGNKYCRPENLPPQSKVDSQPLGKQRLYHRPRSPPRVTAAG